MAADSGRGGSYGSALHKSETETIVLATELNAERLVIDDLDARRFATRCGLKLIGT